MRKFWGFYDNGIYKVGCNGATMYLYDVENRELAKFKDIPYGYRGAFKPQSNIFVLRSTEGWIAVYDCDERKLLHKFRFSDVDGAQDDGFCFSADGNQFMNIEKIAPGACTRLSIYETESFSPTRRLFEDNKSLVLCDIEHHGPADQYNILFFTRDAQGVYDQGYVGVLSGDQIIHRQPIDYKVYNFLRSCKSLQSSGFTEKAMEWSGLHYAGYTNEEIRKIKDMGIDLLSFRQVADQMMK